MRLRDKILRVVSGDPVSVGLDIGNHSVKIVCIRHSPEFPILVSAGVHVLREGTMENGEIKNRNDLQNAVISLINKTALKKTRKVNFSLSWSYGVIAEKMRLKSSKMESDDELILMEASRRSPFDVDDIQLDYKILSKDPASEEMEALLVAAKIGVMEPFLSLLKDTCLEVVNIDVDTFAVTNAYLFSAPEKERDKVICLVDIGDNVSNLTFIKNGVYHSTRDIQAGGSFFIKTIVNKFNIEKAEATAVLKGRSQGDYDENSLIKCIEHAAEELSVGMDVAFSYFKSMEGNTGIDKVILCGGGACIEGLPELLSNRHDIKVEIADPLGKITYDQKRFTSPIPLEISTSLMTAVGLALRVI